MKNIIVAGAGKGIGLKIAELLHQNHHVISIARNLTPELSNLNTTFYSLDLSKETLSSAHHIPDQIHGIVYCPGSIKLKPFGRITPAEFVDDFNQNVMGAVQLIQSLLPQLKNAQGAGIVLFSTVAAKIGMPFHASIATSKAAIEGLTKSLAAELASSAIRVNAIAPSLTNTSLASSLLNTPEKIDAANKRHPLQRIGQPEELATLAAFLLSDDSSWITGQIIGADGGMGSLKV